MDAAIAFAKNVLNTRYEDIAPSVVEVVKYAFLDSLGVIMAGSSVPAAKQVVDLVKEWGGKEESTVIANYCRVPAINAAFANGAMVRALDYNETYETGRTHPTVPVIPAALAISEKVGSVDGKEFVTATTLAFDMKCRLANAVPKPGHWIAPQLEGFFAAAAVTGRLLNLSEEEMVNAIGIAYCQASGGRQSATERVLTRGLQGAFSAKGGVLATLMAKKGVTGPRNSLEGEHGFYNIYYGGSYDRDTLTGDLGKRFEVTESFKPYPCCRALHPLIDATLEIVKMHDIHPDDVDEVTVFHGEFVGTMFEPLDLCRNPMTFTECQFSAPYVAATAIVKRNVTLNEFIGGGFRDPIVLQVAQKIGSKFDPQLARHGVEPSIVEIRTKDGRKLRSRRIEHAKGHLLNPMTVEEHIAKFKDCSLYAARPIARENLEKVIEMISRLEEVENVSEIARLLA